MSSCLSRSYRTTTDELRALNCTDTCLNVSETCGTLLYLWKWNEWKMNPCECYGWVSPLGIHFRFALWWINISSTFGNKYLQFSFFISWPTETSSRGPFNIDDSSSSMNSRTLTFWLDEIEQLELRPSSWSANGKLWC